MMQADDVSSSAEARSAIATHGIESRATGLRRIFCLGLAGFFFVLACLGVFVPGLPATPFLLLTSYFLIRSSPRLNAALLNSRIFGPLLTDWQVHGGIRRHVRVKSIVIVGIVVPLTVILSGASERLTVIVLSLVAVGIATILSLPAVRESQPGATESQAAE